MISSSKTAPITTHSEKMRSFSKLSWFHGHSCPMSTIGYRAGILAKKLLKMKRTDYRNASATVYFRSCALDGVQMSFPATLGNGNLNIVDGSEMRFEFRDNAKAILIEVRFGEALKRVMNEYLNMRKTAGKVKGKKVDAGLDAAYNRFMEFVRTAGDKELFVFSTERV